MVGRYFISSIIFYTFASICRKSYRDFKIKVGKSAFQVVPILIVYLLKLPITPSRFNYFDLSNEGATLEPIE
jgi:hypothetical protein